MGKITSRIDFNNINQHNNAELSIEKTPLNPFTLFEEWYQDVEEVISTQPNAMVLSTVDKNHQPHSRVVLLKEFKDEQFLFFTNYESQKSQEIQVNPQISVNFYWEAIHRQIRIEGICKKTSKEHSDNYFKSRPFLSKVGAVVSKQSSALVDLNKFVENINELKNQYQNKQNELERPDTWGGYSITPFYYEFWQGKSSRLHDRLSYTYVKKEKIWKKKKLFP